MARSLLATAALAGLIYASAQRTFEYMVPMRDGVELHTRIVLPKDYEGNQYTAIVDRSPYGYDGLEWIADIYVPFGFVAIGQDMRGTGLSQGEFSIWHSDANDSYDLGLWIREQSWSNGEVFSFGASADGLASFTMIENQPSWLNAQYIIWASSMGYEVIYPNGAYLQSLADMWIRSTVPDQADECLQEVQENEMPNPWWDMLNLTSQYYKAHGPTAFWAGWYDIFLTGNLMAYDGYQTQGDASIRGKEMITVDPLGHCQDAAGYFTQDLVMGRTALAVLQSFQIYGIRDVKRPILPVTFYVMSSNDTAGNSVGNYWTTLREFPKYTPTSFYLHADGSASLAPPSFGDQASTSYIYDPTNPVPTLGGNNLDIPCGPFDQRPVESRSDMLIFTTEAFTEDFVMTGPLFAKLFVSTSAVDTDFMVKITDVYPTGESRLLQDSAARMRWREGGSEPVFCEAGEVYEITLSLWNTSYIVAAGHQLRFAITSSNAPRFSVNPNNGLPLVDSMNGQGVPIVAENTIFHSAKYPSRLILPKVNKRQLPKIDIIKAFNEQYPEMNLEKLSSRFEKFTSAMINNMKGVRA